MKRFTFDLKTILLVSFVLIGGLPILAMGFIASRIISADVAQDVREKNLLVAQSLSAEVDIFLEKSLSFLRQIEEAVIEKRYVQEDEIAAYLAGSLKINKDFESIEVLDANGVVRYMAPPNPDVIGINRSGQALYAQVRRSNKPFWSPTFISLQIGKPTITLAVPVKGGMIIGYLDLESLNAMTDRVDAGKQGYALIIDRDGTVIAHHDRNKIAERQNLSYLLFQGQEQSSSDRSFSYREDSREYLASLSSVRQTQWQVIHTVPADEAFEPVTRIWAYSGAGAVMVVFVAAVIGFISVRKVSYPLSQLVHDARRISDGSYRFEDRPSSYREVDDLVGQFHSMAMVLQSREEALLASEERFRIAAETSNDLVYVWDLKEHVQWFGAIDEMLGYAPGEFPRTLDGWAASIHPEDLERVMAHVQAHLKENALYAAEYRVRRKDGVYRWWAARGATARTPEGTSVRWIGTVTDITERKHTEMEIHMLNAELEQRVIDRTAQLEAANKELEAFAYSVSHDLRAPLRAVDGYTKILVEDYESSLDAEGKRVCSVISQSARDMGKLIDDLLAFSRVGRTAMQPSTVDMATMARSIFFEITTPENRERIDFNVDQLPHAVGDPTLFRQVWTNLLLNAVKFSSRKDRAVIAVSTGQQGDEVVYSVRDNGAGFDMQYVGKLFGVFQRLHSTKEFEGTGVGLAIVQRIIVRHGGRVWGEGEVDKGATFYFTIGKGD